MQRALSTGAPFSSRHRIVDIAGEVHQIIVIGDQLHSAAGELVGTTGFYVDISDTVESEVRSSLSDVLPEFAAARQMIDRALSDLATEGRELILRKNQELFDYILLTTHRHISRDT